MAKLGISTGTVPNDGMGDSLLDGAIKINSNFNEIYNYLGDGTNLTAIGGTWVTTTVGIHTLKNVGIGTTNPTSTLTVGGNVSISGILTSSSAQLSLLSGTNSNYSGISTVGSLSIGSSQVISSGRELQNITSLDATTTATIESAIQSAPNNFSNLNVSGVSTLGNTIVGGATTQLVVNGDARITGILTIGSSSITLNGSSNTINVGSGITINGSTGIISATSIVINGTSITGGGVTSITAGSGISVNQSTGNVTITATGGGGSSQWVTTAAGIHTLSNVGIGTTNPTSALTVSGSVSITGLSTFSDTLAVFNQSGIAVLTVGHDVDGTGTDHLGIYYDNILGTPGIGGTASVFTSNGDLRFDVNDGISNIIFGNGTSDHFIINGATGNTGIGTTNPTSALTVVGNVSVSGVSTFVGNVFANDVYVGDYDRIFFGNNANLTIGYDTANGESLIRNQTSAPFAIDLGSNSNSKLSIRTGFASTLAYFSRTNVELYESTNKKFETIGAGVTVTGTTFSNQLNVSGVSTFNGNVRFDGDLRLYGTENIKFFDGSNNVIGNITKNGSITYYTKESSEKHIFQNGFGPVQNLFEIGPTNYSYRDLIVSGLTSTTTLTVGSAGTIITTTSGGLVGIGTTNPSSKLTVHGEIQIQQDSSSNNRLILRGQPSSSYRWNIDNHGSNNDFRIFREDDATASNGSVAVSISTNRTVTLPDGDLKVGVSTARGVILTSPNGTQYRLIVSDAGALSTVAV